ncbi:MAG TPA: polysaccharide deacetylase family protein [Bacillota bacterium]|nr:polysaccharide deacetylase family protein [Bacillota bacterium]
MKKWLLLSCLCLLIACSANKKESSSPHQAELPRPAQQDEKDDSEPTIRDIIINKYQGQSPTAWGEALHGIQRHIDTDQLVVALTFDACGGIHGSGYDADLINYLREMKIPATLFINSRWIDANSDTFRTLSQSPLFEIENHGSLHKPLSVNGRSEYGIQGTKNPGEVVDEVQLNHEKIEKLTGKAPKFFRSGTAFYDDVAVNIVADLKERPVGYSVLGDAGATFHTEQVKHALMSAKPGSIVILHMNQPSGDTAEGVKAAIPELIKRGLKFVKLSDLPLKE